MTSSKPITSFYHYREFLNYKISHRAEIRGEKSLIAKKLKIHPSYLSQILSGKKDLSTEQAFDICLYWNFTEQETDYFLEMLYFEKSGNFRMRDYHKKRLDLLKKNMNIMDKKYGLLKTLDEKNQAIYYSHWMYCAIRIALTLNHQLSLEHLQKLTKLPLNLVQRSIDFLMDNNLIRSTKNGYVVTEKSIKITRDSPQILNHHRNWRLKALERSPNLIHEESLITAPLSISRKDAVVIQFKIQHLLNEIKEIVNLTSPEEVWCLNIDWFLPFGE